ncbi:hypothetical protein WG66_008230 [Moniliophthora roreri]|nr:hypothetical protein WG66_008230 [Moniliophthora roreri]
MDKARLSMLLQLVKDARTTNYATVAAMTLLLRLLLDDRKGGGINMEDAEEAGKHHIFMLREVKSDRLMGITITVIISTVDLVLLMSIELYEPEYIHVGCSALLRLHGGPLSDSGESKVPTPSLTRRPDTFIPPVLHYARHDDLQMQSNFVFLEWEDCTNAYYFALHARWDILVPICFRFGFPASSFFDALID